MISKAFIQKQDNLAIALYPSKPVDSRNWQNLLNCGAIGLILVLLSHQAAFTATSNVIPLPDRRGDYYRNEAPVKGYAPSPLMPGSLWRVVATKLNCRQNPGSNYPIQRQFKLGDILQAEVGRGGADEVLVNALDNHGFPWMAVRGKTEDERCYVRANNRYLRPIKP